MATQATTSVFSSGEGVAVGIMKTDTTLRAYGGLFDLVNIQAYAEAEDELSDNIHYVTKVNSMTGTLLRPATL